MADDELNIDDLADYLHLHAGQVARLAERGKLPARKVAGQWKFSRADVHQWLERQIGLSTGDELMEMEGRLARNAAEPHFRIADMLPLEAIAIPLSARTRGSVITSMTALAAKTGWLWDAEKMAEAVRAREDMLPTALENGVALLHSRRPMPHILGLAFVALGRTSSGIAFGAPQGNLTDLFFLICSLEDRGHLRVLARLSRLLSDPGLLTALREAPDAQITQAVFVSAEADLQ